MNKATIPGPIFPMLGRTVRHYGIKIVDGDIAERAWKFLDHHAHFVALGVTILFGALLFIWTATWPETPDGLLHLHRVRALADALQDGVIYPRWFPDFAFGYGYPVFNYYAPGFYYPPALLHLAGLDLLTSVRITLALSFALSGWWMFCLVQKYVSFWPAMITLICFQCFPYRLYDLFIRGALPEFVAFMWLPLIAHYGLQSLESRKISSEVGKAGFAWTALILTHNLTALMAAIIYCFALGLHVLCRVGRWQTTLKTLASGVMPLIIGLLLSAWYVAPALWEAQWVAIGQTATTRGYLNHMASWGTLIDFQPLYLYPSAAQATVPLPAYLIPLMGIALFVVMTKRIQHHFIILLLTMGSIWVTTSSSAWLWNSSELWSKLQFPWRWHTMIALGTALLLALSIEAIFQAKFFQNRPWSVLSLLSIALSGYLVIYSWHGLDYPIVSPPEISEKAMWQWDSAHGQVGATWTGEFLPIWVTEQRWAISREPSEPATWMPDQSVKGLKVTPLEIQPLQHKFRVHTEQTFQMMLHQFYFPAWQATIDNLGTVEVKPATDLGLVSVTISPGEHIVTFTWTTTKAVWLGLILTVIGLVVLMLLDRTTVQRRIVASMWFAIGLTILTVTSGMLTPYEQELSTVGADFGMLRLEGAEFTPTQAGGVALVNLIWSVKGAGEPLVAFVHLVDERGTVLAQYDCPPGGEYTPHTRWAAGLIMESEHPILIPDTLLPGSYGLKAGLYRPGMADAPLLPFGYDDFRVDIGALTVKK